MPEGLKCSDWTTDTVTEDGLTGDHTATDATWTSARKAGARSQKSEPLPAARDVVPLTSDEQNRAAYLSFWNSVGTNFPSLKGAASTDYYFQCERTLCSEYFPKLNGQRIFKTDLWDEAKNTEILRWTAEQGARP